MRVFIVIYIFLSFSNTFGHSKALDIYDYSYVINYNTPILSLEQATQLCSQKKYIGKLQKTSFQNFNKKKCTWIVVFLPEIDQPQYITVGNALFDEINLYDLESKKEIPNIRDDLNLRQPAWEISTSKTPQTLLLKLKEQNAGFKTYLNLKNSNLDVFVSTTQIEYILFGSILFSLLLLTLITFYIAFQRKSWGVFWFGINLLFVIVRIATATGVTSQIGIDKSFILRSDIHALAPNISVFSMLMFYYLFYNYPEKSIFLKKFFKILIFSNAFILLLNICNVFLVSKMNTEVITQINIFICIAVCLIIHLYLIHLKAIPSYILIAFILPPTFVMVNANTMRPLDVSLFWQYFFMMMVYIAKLFECLLVILYIISSSLKKEFVLVKTEKENAELKLKLTNKIGEIEKKYRNKLLGDVHDTLGSYIASLQLSFKHKKIDHNVILASFNKEYRMLLNNLYHPTINEKNLINHIESYTQKINELSNCSVIFQNQFIDKHKISEEKANEIYKIIIELVINAVKHSKALKVEVVLTNTLSTTYLTIKDNGVGFIVNHKPITSFGLNSVQERVRFLNGNFNIHSEMNVGTEINIELPNE